MTRAAVLIVSLACLLAQSRPADLGDWTLEYDVSGGIAFNTHSVKVGRAGTLAAADHRLGMDVDARAPDDLLATVGAFLKTARDAPKRPVNPDEIVASLAVQSAGRRYALAITPEIRGALESAWSEAIGRALVGSWTQSAWKLCTPTERLTSADMDVPVDDLTFRADGTFAVTWRGGGAHTTGVPHVDLPDYAGRYTLDPRSGAMHLRVGDGVPTPRDFAGDGTFGIAKGQLTLKQAWLGTRTAPRRPDLCELTFTRK